MLVRIINLTILLIIIQSKLSSQNKQDLLNNINIVWLAEGYLEFQPILFEEPGRKDKNYTELKGNNRFKLLKSVTVNSTGLNENNNSQLNRILIKDYPEIALYSTNLLKHKLSLAQKNEIFIKKDTLTIFDPETYEEVPTVETFALRSEQFVRFRLHYLLYYDKSTNAVHLQPLAVCPLYSDYNYNGKFDTFRSYFWLKVGILPKLSWHSPSVTLVKRMYRTVALDSVIILKNNLVGDEIKLTDYLVQHLPAKIYKDADLTKKAKRTTLAPIAEEKLELTFDYCWNYEQQQLYITPISIGLLDAEEQTPFIYQSCSKN